MEIMTDEESAAKEAAIAAAWAERAPYVADYYTRRELRLMLNCIAYRDGDPAGVPGHNLMILVAKLAGDNDLTEDRLYELLDAKAAE